jgi:hypothetical protein
MKYSIVATTCRVPVLVRNVPDHDGGPLVLLRFWLRCLAGVAGDLGILEQEAGVPPAPPASPNAAAARSNLLVALFAGCRSGGRRGGCGRNVLATFALAFVARASIATLGLIAGTDDSCGASPEEYHSFPCLPGAGGGGCSRRLQGRCLGRSPHGLMPRRCRRAWPAVGEHVPTPANDTGNC